MADQRAPASFNNLNLLLQPATIQISQMQNQFPKQHIDIASQIAALNRKQLPLIEANKICKSWPFNESNLQGFVNFGFATNSQVSRKTLEFFPAYINTDQCGYEQLRGSPFLRELLSRNSGFTVEQTVLFNSLSGLVDTLAFRQKVSYKGSKVDVTMILEHTQAVEVPIPDADLCFIEVNSREQVEKLVKGESQKQTVIVIPDRSWLIPTHKPEIIYAYQHYFPQGFTCAVAFSHNEALLSSLEKGALVFHALSTLYPATVQACQASPENQSLEKQFMESVRGKQPTMEAILKMIELDTGYVPEEGHLFMGIGSTCCLNNWAFSLFKQGDKVGIDTPFYFFFKHDFAKSGIVLSYRSIQKGSLLERVQQSYEAGEKGYIIVSPHNPTGIVIEAQEILDVCEWGANHPDYHLLFDEIYRKSAHKSETVVQSALKYADKYQNFSLIRGFSKDFGLCGFRAGFIVSCNSVIRQNFSKWSSLIRPQPYLLHGISLMLQKSSYAQQIYQFNKKCLSHSTEVIVSCLKGEGIQFIEPRGGMFLMINLSKYIQLHPQATEKSIKSVLFYDYRVNVFQGMNFQAAQPGKYRLCYLIPEESICEGIHRIGKFIRGQPMGFAQK